MNHNAKDILRNIIINALGAVAGVGILTFIAFVIGKINLVVLYWREVLFIFIFILIVIAFISLIKKMELLEKELQIIKRLPQADAPDQNKEITNLKSAIAKKADISIVPNIREFKYLQRTVKELEIFKHAQKGQMGEIMGLIELLQGDIDSNSWRIEDVLEDLEEAISKTTLDGSRITEIEEQLCRLEKMPKYNFLVNKIRKHYQNL